MERLLYPVDEARERAGGMSRSTFYGLVRSGRISTVKVGSRTLVAADELERFVTSLTGTQR
jgi:excisionase family DNA binding protein